MSVLRDGEIAIRARIYGKVQGVWYRGWTQETASQLGVFGWARNRTDGSVEVLLCGMAEAVNALLEKAKKGPPSAKVDHIETEPAKGITPRRFDVKPTV